jgi:hypothetical protein
VQEARVKSNDWIYQLYIKEFILRQKNFENPIKYIILLIIKEVMTIKKSIELVKEGFANGVAEKAVLHRKSESYND